MTADFFKAKFGYEIEGVWFPRVTSITSPFQKKWQGLRSAAEWGTLIHETVESILRGEEAQPDRRCEVSIATFLSWRNQYPIAIQNPAHDIEKRVFDVEHGYAGTIDMVAEVEGVVGIIDLKTSTAIYKEHSLQTAAYLQAYNKTKGIAKACQTRWILRLDEYAECLGCLAKKRNKYGRARAVGGKDACNHQWSELKGEVEFKELADYEKDFDAFLDLKERWEWANKEWLDQIPNYEKNIRQYTLL
ncbi:MAG TPA: PD-(D/E)XK nuclease family protein [Candidatus Paceibacterota bacterium]